MHEHEPASLDSHNRETFNPEEGAKQRAIQKRIACMCDTKESAGYKK